jgi:hypothetical protein
MYDILLLSLTRLVFLVEAYSHPLSHLVDIYIYTYMHIYICTYIYINMYDILLLSLIFGLLTKALVEAQ